MALDDRVTKLESQMDKLKARVSDLEATVEEYKWRLLIANVNGVNNG